MAGKTGETGHGRTKPACLENETGSGTFVPSTFSSTPWENETGSGTFVPSTFSSTP